MKYCVYILANKNNNVLYIGVTSNLERRVLEHKQKKIRGFTSKYKINKLVFFETFPTAKEAIIAEKKIKGWRRIRKINLIEEKNSDWKDLTLIDRDPSLHS